MEDIYEFKREYEDYLLNTIGVEKVEYVGSLATGTFRPGKSDADIICHCSRRIPISLKRESWKKLEELNYKYKLGLETALCQHPTPFFLENPVENVAFKILWDGQVIKTFLPLRTLWRKRAPTYGEVWRIGFVPEKIIKLYGGKLEPWFQSAVNNVWFWLS